MSWTRSSSGIHSVHCGLSPSHTTSAYWATRLGRSPELRQRVAALLQQQRGRCAWCGLPFTSEEHWEVDHRIPLAQGGRDFQDNLQLLHGHCHNQKKAGDMARAGVLLTTSQTSEEPCEVK